MHANLMAVFEARRAAPLNASSVGCTRQGVARDVQLAATPHGDMKGHHLLPVNAVFAVQKRNRDSVTTAFTRTTIAGGHEPAMTVASRPGDGIQ